MKYKKNAALLKEDINIPSNKIKPLIIYNASLFDKFKALKDNIGKSVIYR
jgi:hypothetical protein